MHSDLSLMIYLIPVLFEFILFFQGEVGDWKNWYTVSQNERHDAMIQEEMKDMNFDLKLIYEI